jgi:formate dehydrogenase major subunit
MLAMMDAAIAGPFKALWAIGYDVYLTNARADETARALGALELLIVQDLFLTESARAFGTVFLPACSSFEHDGTFMNAERRIQRVRAAVPPVGGARADWRILADVAAAMGSPGFAFSGPEAIWDEVREVAPGARGMTYARLDAGGLQWPCPTEAHPGTVRLYETPGPRFTLRPIEDQPSPEQPTADYPMLLTTGRTLYHFNAGTMTMRTPNATLLGSDVLDVADADARALGIADGDRVRVVSAYGTAALPARVSGAVRPGQLFATFHTAEVFLNRVTGPHRDGRVATSEYKVTAVRVEPAPG